jgi:hypothetical protein
MKDLEASLAHQAQKSELHTERLVKHMSKEIAALKQELREAKKASNIGK